MKRFIVRSRYIHSCTSGHVCPWTSAFGKHAQLKLGADFIFMVSKSDTFGLEMEPRQQVTKASQSDAFPRCLCIHMATRFRDSVRPADIGDGLANITVFGALWRRTTLTSVMGVLLFCKHKSGVLWLRSCLKLNLRSSSSKCVFVLLVHVCSYVWLTMCWNMHMCVCCFLHWGFECVPSGSSGGCGGLFSWWLLRPLCPPFCGPNRPLYHSFSSPIRTSYNTQTHT